MRILYWISGLIFLLILSYYREVVFLSINEVLNNTSPSKFNRLYDILSEYDLKQLTQLKYYLTAIATALFILITLAFLKISFRDKAAFSIGLLLYALIMLIVLSLAGFWTLSSNFDHIYPSMRFFIEYLHSPFIYLLLSTIPIVKDQLQNVKFN